MHKHKKHSEEYDNYEDEKRKSIFRNLLMWDFFTEGGIFGIFGYNENRFF